MDFDEIKNKINSNIKVLYDNNKEYHARIGNHDFRYIKNSHSYIIDGFNVLSVSHLIRRINPDLYKDVDKKILNKAGRRGSIVHEEIEYYEKTGLKGFTEEFSSYLSLKEELNIKSLGNEIFIIICNTNNEPILAGRLDMVYLRDNLIGIMDFKRTVELYKDNVTLQLNLYAYGFKETYGIDINELAVMRLRDNFKEFVQIEQNKDIAETAILAYL
ncbi:MAG: hypothetical protein K6G28_02650 [Acholeplasmatales bacterium]|nr:hypothetical protein [Acholeplasmatales bacterium]